MFLCLMEVGVSEAWTSRSCKCDCEGGEPPTEFSTIGTGSMVRGVDCMPGKIHQNIIPACFCSCDVLISMPIYQCHMNAFHGVH